MVILDDAGQYDNMRGDRWQLVSIPRRFKTLGEKRNATLGLIPDKADAVCLWDDDDLYLPWHLTSAAATLEHAPWSRPSLVLYEHPEKLKARRTNGLYQGGWSLRLEERPGLTGRGLPGGVSYTATSINEDQVLACEMSQRNVSEADPIQLGQRPSYIYRDASSESYHASYMGDCRQVWQRLGTESRWMWDKPPLTHEQLNEMARARGVSDWIHWPRDYRALPIDDSLA
jgi:hypothetical protein